MTVLNASPRNRVSKSPTSEQKKKIARGKLDGNTGPERKAVALAAERNVISTLEQAGRAFIA